ncbi:hypothetical protein BCON_0032g00640 [Botryotinia convoluta]|uniref:Uncharacterized protein n=1 Tax=Botryotinia convoluta TaxID=54673 RepID=A0A4Z1IHC7_9HELO|nr:hypothetical protein BCON_0032g00640 [Botryotinia convoluta]
MSFNAEGLYLVRRFSELTRNEKIAEPLSQGLAEKVDDYIERERKGKYFYEEVTQKTKKVNQVIGNYGHDLYSLPGFLECKLSNLEKNKAGVPIMSRNNGTDILLLTTQLQRDILQKKQKSKGAKVKNFLKRTVQSLENHKYFFALLPSGDKYTSVLTGAFSVLVKVRDYRTWLQTYTTRVAAEERHISEEQNHMQLLQIGNMVHKLLLDNKELKERLNEISPPTTPESKRQRGSVGAWNHSGVYVNNPNSSLNSSLHWSKESMLEDSEFLRQYIQASVDVDRLIVMSQSLVINADISTRIRQWIIAPSSGILWIEGPHGVEQPGQNTLVSAFILRNLRLAHLPVVAEFYHYDARDWRTWNPATELLKFVYSLIGQSLTIALKIIAGVVQGGMEPLNSITIFRV